MADKIQAQVAHWRQTHPDLQVTEAGLLTMAPFASLYASDFLVYAERKGLDKEAVDFFRSMHRELVWVYGLLSAAQRDSDPAKLFQSILVAARPAGGPDQAFYATICKFLKDYAEANNIILDDRELQSWEATFAAQEVTAPVEIEKGGKDARP